MFILLKGNSFLWQKYAQNKAERYLQHFNCARFFSGFKGPTLVRTRAFIFSHAFSMRTQLHIKLFFSANKTSSTKPFCLVPRQKHRLVFLVIQFFKRCFTMGTMVHNYVNYCLLTKGDWIGIRVHEKTNKFIAAHRQI